MGKKKKKDLAPEPASGGRSFGQLEFWNAAFEGGEFAEPFDWLASWEDVRAEVERAVPDKSSRVLIPGCGNAPFQLDMCGAGGYRDLTCGDSSEVVIRKMAAACRESHPGIRWELMDASDMSYADGSFDAVIDKSLMDALLCSDDAARRTRLYFDEVFRVLAPGGVLVLISCHRELSVRANLRGRDCRITGLQEVRLQQQPDGGSGSAPAAAGTPAEAPKGSAVTLCTCVKGSGGAAAEADPEVPELQLRKKSRDERRKAAKMQRRMVQAHMEDAELA